MNITNGIIKILCYGDSNTWGQVPDGVSKFSSVERWTGQLQQKLGNSYEIIEEGLPGRTTAFDDPKEVGRNGKSYLIPCLRTHNPIDIVVLMLGTNDLKEKFKATPEMIAHNIEDLIKIIKEIAYTEENKIPQVIILSPAYINEKSLNTMDGIKGAEEKSKQFSSLFEVVAINQKCEFIDIAEYISTSDIDGCHLDKKAHTLLAELLFKKITSTN